jgi:hypothetical protein
VTHVNMWHVNLEDICVVSEKRSDQNEINYPLKKYQVENVKSLTHTRETGYNDIGLHDTPSITSDVLWYQVFPPCQP